MLTPGQPYSR